MPKFEVEGKQSKPMKYPVKYKRAYNEEGDIVNIDSVKEENRLPIYYSIGTRTPMEAVIGEIKQHYYRAKRGYKINPETELHKYVKNILKYRFDTSNHFYIKYYRKECCPKSEQCIFSDEKNGCDILCEQLCEYDLKAFYDKATIEGEHDGFDADVLLTSSSKTRRPVFLEVAVTHPCTEEKKASGNKIVEIFVKREDDAFCELTQPELSIFYNEKPIIIFHNFDDKITIRECAHFSGNKKYAQQPYRLITAGVPTKFYCSPQQLTGGPIQAYYDNTQIGMLFANNKFAKPFVFDKAISLNKKKFIMMGKDIYGAVKPWVIYVVTWNGKDYYHRISSHFDYNSALKDFTISQGKQWNGGETLSDQCM